MKAYSLVVLMIALTILSACGDNILQNPQSQSSISPPQNLRAFSVNQSTVSISWTASTSATDTAFAGYTVYWGTRQDTVGESVLSYVIDSLAGEVTVSVRSRMHTGTLSDAVSINCAPAARFDAPSLLTEYYNTDPSRLAGFDVGGQNSDPLRFAINVADPAVAAQMDCYLFGGEGEIELPLELRSANVFFGPWNVTLFSTVSHSSTSLDYPLAAFPDVTTFTENHVDLENNTIYYVRVVGDQGGVNYARLHVRLLGGSQRNRSVEIRVSLQRLPGVLFAFVPSGDIFSLL
ncbi:MAG: fibronectin type III domain-containing protein [Bacteroidota bacterium]